MEFEGKRSRYFEYGVVAEYYRLILNGYCSKKSAVKNFTPDMLLRENKPVEDEVGHSKSWNSIKNYLNKSDGISNHETVLQYYNLQQGTSAASKNMSLDRVSLNKEVNRIISSGLRYSADDLQLDDPLKKRRISSELLGYIIERVDSIVEDEKASLKAALTKLQSYLDLDETGKAVANW